MRTDTYTEPHGLAFFYTKLADDPEDGIINAATFFQRNGFPADQVLVPFRLSYPRERLTKYSRVAKLGIQFIQVGNDTGVEQFLDELDVGLVQKMGEHARVRSVSAVFCSHGAHAQASCARTLWTPSNPTGVTSQVTL